MKRSSARCLCAAWLTFYAGAVPPRGPIQFEDVAQTAGLAFTIENSATARKHLPETMAGGVAACDFDNDGWTDIFFANGATMPGLAKDGARFHNRLFRNLGGMRFRDVTAAAGVSGSGYSMAPIAGDFDNDGNVDLFLAGVKHNLLYRNRGDGSFVDVTAASGIASSEWAVGGAWLDFDSDGLLDLFVVNYVKWDASFDEYCGDSARQIRVYCHPRVFQGTANQLYRNLGGGRFEDVSRQSGIAAHIGKGMAVAVADYDGDGRPDLFVTNDRVPNFLFHNVGGGGFEEVAFDAGVALVDAGTDVSAMGAAFQDLDRNGFPDLIVTALFSETFPLFFNQGKGRFRDAGIASGMGRASRVYSGWGVGIADFDNDGLPDVFSANSHVNDRVAEFEATVYKQPNAVFRNTGNGRFEDVSSGASAGFAQAARAHRGSAFADFDHDGRLDAVVASLQERAELWRNTSAGTNGWIVLRLVGVKSNRDGIGAVVRTGAQVNQMTASVGYASSSHAGVHFGLGPLKVIDRIDIKWPSGTAQTLRNIKANQILEVREPASR